MIDYTVKYKSRQDDANVVSLSKDIYIKCKGVVSKDPKKQDSEDSVNSIVEFKKPNK